VHNTQPVTSRLTWRVSIPLTALGEQPIERHYTYLNDYV